MREIEVKAKVKDFKSIIKKLEELGCELNDPLIQSDRIYLHKYTKFSEIKIGTPVLRIRESNGKYTLTLKKRISNELNKSEYEIIINSPQEAEKIIENIDFYLSVRVNKKRIKCKYKDMEICLDIVNELGDFIEVEKLSEEVDSQSIQEELFQFLEKLGISREDRVFEGYDTMIYFKNNPKEIKNEENKENIEKIFDFLQIVNGLKKTKRFGKYDIEADSPADHSWRLCLMAFIIADELKIDINIIKAMKIALVHDLPESITGDIPYVEIHYGNTTKDDKQKKEIEAMKTIIQTLPFEISKEIHELWEEYEYSKSREALFIKALDKIETITHVVEKTREYSHLDLVASYTDKHVNNFPELIPVLKELKKRLKIEFEKRGLEWKKEYDGY